MERIKAVIVPEVDDAEDVWMWPGGSQGDFSVSVTYGLLCGFPRLPTQLRWNKIWKLAVPERVRFFIWLVCHNRLMTNQRKASMQLGEPYCKGCEIEVETSLHVLRDCPQAMVIWMNLLDEYSRIDFFDLELNDWIELNMNNHLGYNKELDWRSVWSTACHLLWQWRNKEAFVDDYVRPFEPWHVIVQHSKDYLKALQENTPLGNAKHVKYINWIPPSRGWLRLNTDGACSHVSNTAGCGGIIRGEDGSWVAGFSKNLGSCTTFVAEVWGLWEGLQLAHRMGVTKLEVNLDSQSVVQCLNGNASASHLAWRLLTKIKNLLNGNWEVRISHIFREANKCADALASIGCHQEVEFVVYDSAPIEVRNLVAADASGVSTPRLVPV